MMGSRKFFVLPAALALALVGSDAALGQFCNVIPTTGRQVRAEGLSERVDDIVVACSTGAVDAITNMKITVDLNARITNKINSNDDKQVDTITATHYITTAAFTTDATPPYATANDQANKTKLIGNNAVELVISTPLVGSSGTLRIRIRGIRVNAAAVGAGNPITATVATTQLVLFRDTVTVARTKAGLVSKRIGYVGSSGTVNEPVEGLACAASKKINSSDRGDDLDITINDIEVKEGFATAFQGADTVLDGDVDSNVRIMLSFKDIPAGVGVHLRPQPNCSYEAGGSGAKREGTEGSYMYRKNAAETSPSGTVADYLELTLMNGLDGNGAGTGSTAVPGDEDDNYVQVNLSGGAGTAVYEVTADGGGAADDCDIPIAFVWGSGVELGSGTVSASLAPVSSVAGAHVDAGIPRFVPTVKTLEVINIEDCSTTLLFPFVTNQADYDTGIAISNTSQDAFGTTENEGACTTYFYGSMMGGAAAPDAYTSDSVAAGGQLVFLLSRQAAGFQGYLMVRCNFQFAHGLAFLTNGAGGGTPSLAQSYLALVVPVQHGDRGVSTGGHEMLSQ